MIGFMSIAMILQAASLGLKASLDKMYAYYYYYKPIGTGIWAAFFGWFAAGFGIGSVKSKSMAFGVVSLVFVSQAHLWSKHEKYIYRIEVHRSVELQNFW